MFYPIQMRLKNITIMSYRIKIFAFICLCFIGSLSSLYFGTAVYPKGLLNSRLTYSNQRESSSNLTFPTKLNWSKYTPGNISGPSVLLSFVRKFALGNGLFVYACSYSIARKYDIPLYLFLLSKDDEGLENFNIPVNHLNRVNPNWTASTSTIRVLDSEINTEMIAQGVRNNSVLFLREYCQSEDFFAPYKNEILEQFTIKENTTLALPSLWTSLIDNSKNPVAVHVRRGDFIHLKRNVPIWVYEVIIPKMHKILTMERNESTPTYFLFSDDIPLVLKELSKLISEKSLKFYFVENLRPIQDFALMTRCKHAVIGNSSYAWWAAYLIKNKKKVVIAVPHDPSRLLKRGTNNNSSLKNWNYFPSTWIKFNITNYNMTIPTDPDSYFIV